MNYIIHSKLSNIGPPWNWICKIYWQLRVLRIKFARNLIHIMYAFPFLQRKWHRATNLITRYIFSKEKCYYIEKTIKQNYSAYRDNDVQNEQRKNLNAEVSALKTFILEQRYVTLWKIFVLKTLHPSNVQLIENLKEEMWYFRN